MDSGHSDGDIHLNMAGLVYQTQHQRFVDIVSHQQTSQHHQPPTQHHHPPTQHHQPPTQHHHPSTQHHQPPTQHHHPPTQHHQPPTQHHHPPTQYHQPPTQHHHPPTQHQLSPTQHQLAPTQHQLSPTQRQLSPTQQQLSPTQQQLSSTQHQLSAIQHQFTTNLSELSLSLSQVSSPASQVGVGQYDTNPSPSCSSLASIPPSHAHTSRYDPLRSSNTSSGVRRGHFLPEACVVCGDLSTGLHYGTMSCEGCKGFFKRTVQNHLSYTCREYGNCSISRKTRNNCQHCRFIACLNSGMRREAVREDRTPGGSRRTTRLPLLTSAVEVASVSHHNDDLTVTASATSADRPMSSVESRRSERDEYDHAHCNALIEKLIEARPDIEPVNLVLGDDGKVNVGTTMEFAYEELRLIIDWAKKIPGFRALPMADQTLLLKNSFIDINYFRLAFRCRLCNEGYIRWGASLTLSANESKDLWGEDIIGSQLEFNRKLNQLNIDLPEFSCMSALILLSPDCVDLVEKAAVMALQLDLLESLRLYSNKRSRSMNRYGKLLLRLASLKTASRLALERFRELNFQGKLNIDELAAEFL